MHAGIRDDFWPSCENCISNRIVLLELRGQKRGENGIFTRVLDFQQLLSRPLQRFSWYGAHGYKGLILNILWRLHFTRILVPELWGQKWGKNGIFTRFLYFSCFLQGPLKRFFKDCSHRKKGWFCDHPAKTVCQERSLFLSYGGKNRVIWHFHPVFGFSAVFLKNQSNNFLDIVHTS